MAQKISNVNPLLLAAQALLSHSRSSSSSSSSSTSSILSSTIDTSIPPQLIDRFASHSRIKSLVKVFDPEAQIENEAVEIIDTLLTYFVEDWTQMASEVALARADPSIDCGVGGVVSTLNGNTYIIGPSTSSQLGPPILSVNDFHAYISSAAYPYMILPTDELATHLIQRGPPLNASLEPLVYKAKIATLPAEREIIPIIKVDSIQPNSTSSSASNANANASASANVTSATSGKEKSDQNNEEGGRGGGGGGGGGGVKRKRGTVMSTNEEKKAKTNDVVSNNSSVSEISAQQNSNSAAKIIFKMKVPTVPR